MITGTRPAPGPWIHWKDSGKPFKSATMNKPLPLLALVLVVEGWTHFSYIWKPANFFKNNF